MKKQVTLDQVKGAAAYLAKIMGVKFDAPYSESKMDDIALEGAYGKHRLTTYLGSKNMTDLLTKGELLNWILAYREGLEDGIMLQASRQMEIKRMEKFNTEATQ